MSCYYCKMDMHFLCSPDNSCCCNGNITPDNDPTDVAEDTEEISLNLTEKRPVGRPIKGVGYENQLAAGRKYAARHFPIADGTICEWAWQKNCGGGVMPILGCSGRLATNIHHGPDKSTLNNDRATNISQICSFCHNLWHTRNDEFYTTERREDGKPWIPDGPCYPLSAKEPADKIDIINHELLLGREVDKELIREVFGSVMPLDKQ